MTLRIVGMVPSVVAGYILTVAIEIPVLFAGLRDRYTTKQKLVAGLALTGFSYPFVCFVFPRMFPVYEPGSIYLWVAEIFAPVSECILFLLLFGCGKSLRQRDIAKDMLTIILANLISFVVGELLKNANLIEFVW